MCKRKTFDSKGKKYKLKSVYSMGISNIAIFAIYF